MSAQRNCFLSLSPGSTLNPGFSLVQPGVQENRRRIVTQAKATADPSAAQPEVQTSVCPSEIGRHSPQSLLVQESAIESPAQVEPAQFRRMGCSLKAPPHFRPRSGQTRRAVGANPRWNVEALCDPFGVEWVFGFEPWANAHGYSCSVPSGQPGGGIQNRRLPLRASILSDPLVISIRVICSFFRVASDGPESTNTHDQTDCEAG